ISTEHFIGMIGSATIFGICPAMMEWGNVATFSLLIWFFIPFLLASRVFTTPEFMERRFNYALRQFFAVVTVILNVIAFLAAVLYGGGLALQSLFGPGIRALLAAVLARLGHAAPPEAYAGADLWFAIAALGAVAGSWAIYGGLKSVAWTELFTVIIMVVGGLMVSTLGLYMLSGESHSVIEGFRVMFDRNRANHGIWKEVVERNAEHLAPGAGRYNRLSVVQPLTHQLYPWPAIIFLVFTVSIWYNVINQFMIQRVLGARDMYHARMGIVLAGYLKILMPVLIVLPGLIMFARYPEVLALPPERARLEADKGYIRLLHAVAPVGLRGVFLAALFGAVQSAVNSVLNATATVFTLDIYKRMLEPAATERRLVRVGMISSVVILAVAIVLAGFIGRLGEGLFVYIQTLYAFFAPPFGAVFLLGILFRRINGQGATAAVALGFLLSIGLKVYVGLAERPIPWLVPFAMQSIVVWAFCVAVCAGVSLLTPPPPPERVTDQLTFNWRRLNLFTDLGDRWYTSVVTWWALFVLIVVGLILVFSGLWF
ncbi:MAG: sodium/solute symporter, partial [Phycisphaerae bacterium]